MINFSTQRGQHVTVDPDLIGGAEATPDTVLTLLDGSRHVVSETLQEVVDMVRAFHASLLVAVGSLADSANDDAVVLPFAPGARNGQN